MDGGGRIARPASSVATVRPPEAVDFAANHHTASLTTVSHPSR